MTTAGIPTRKPRPLNVSAGTETREGLIPHLRITYAGGVLHAPVKVWPPVKGETLPRPMLDREKRMVFALPGGGEWVA